jgi:uncharacterized NAD(P)/FAD-binding protein YdhS
MDAGLVGLRIGRVTEILPDGAALQVRVRAGQNNSCWQQAQHVVCCAGPLLDYRRIQTPLVASLRGAGHLVPDPLGLGLLADGDGALLEANSLTSKTLFTLGASRRPAYFESTAVPELREQAAALAAVLASRIANSGPNQ